MGRPGSNQFNAYIDISSDEQTVVACGSSYDTTFTNFGSYWTPVLISYDINFQLNWHYSFGMTSNHLVPVDCKFGGPSDNIYYIFS
jgi:hypothetical protein